MFITVSAVWPALARIPFLFGFLVFSLRVHVVIVIDPLGPTLVQFTFERQLERGAWDCIIDCIQYESKPSRLIRIRGGLVDSNVKWFGLLCGSSAQKHKPKHVAVDDNDGNTSLLSHSNYV